MTRPYVASLALLLWTTFGVFNIQSEEPALKRREPWPGQSKPESYCPPLNGYAARGYGGQCTAFVWGRAYEKGFNLPDESWGHAYQWHHTAENWGYQVGKQARANSIAVLISDSGAGHVCFVEDVTEHGRSARISEANWSTYNEATDEDWGGGYDGRIKTVSLTSPRKGGSEDYHWTAFIYLDGGSSAKDENAGYGRPGNERKVFRSSSTAQITSVSPNPLLAKRGKQNLMVLGYGFDDHAKVTLKDLRTGDVSDAGLSILSRDSTTITLSVGVFTMPARWSVTVANPGEKPSKPFEFEVVGEKPQPSGSARGGSFSSGSASSQRRAESDQRNGRKFEPSSTSSRFENRSEVDGFRNADPRNYSPRDVSRPALKVKVLDAATGGHVPLAIVTWGSARAAPSDEPGEYIILSAPSSGRLLRVAAPNYETNEFDYPGGGGDSHLEVVLTPIRRSSPEVGAGANGNGRRNRKERSGFRRSQENTNSGRRSRIQPPPEGGQIRPSIENTRESHRPAASPPPQISGVAPNPVPAMEGKQRFTIRGENFDSGARITLHDSNYGTDYKNPRVVSRSDRHIELNAGFGDESGIWTVRVSNPDGRQSEIFQFEVRSSSANPSGASASMHSADGVKSSTSHVGSEPGSRRGEQPRIVAVAPNPATGFPGKQKFTVLGTSFHPEAEIVLRDHSTGEVFDQLNVRNRSDSMIELRVGFTTNAARWSIEVINPGGRSSGKYQFSVVSPDTPSSSQQPSQRQAVRSSEVIESPRISGVSPDPVVGARSRQAFAVLGSGFHPQANVVLRDLRTGEVFDQLNVTGRSSSRIDLHVGFTTMAATWEIEVINPERRSSGGFRFRVLSPENSSAPASSRSSSSGEPKSAPEPRISGVSPNPVTGSRDKQRFSILGRNFDRSARIILRDLRTGEEFDSVTVTGRSASQIDLSVRFMEDASTWSVEIINPGGRSSGQYRFDVRSPRREPQEPVRPRVTAVRPESPRGTTTKEPFSLIGRDFDPSAKVVLRDLRTGEVFDNPKITRRTQTRIDLSVAFWTDPATWSVEVINPGNQSSGQYRFSVR